MAQKFDGRPLRRARRCTQGKISYVTEEHALLIAAVHSKKFGDLLFPYWHSDCDQYHLTRTPQTPEQADALALHLRQLKRA